MSSMGFSMLNSKVHLRSSLQSIPDESPSPFDRIVHDQGLSTSAASGGLKPPPIRRLRWAYHHLLYSIATRAFLTHLGLPLVPDGRQRRVQISIHSTRRLRDRTMLENHLPKVVVKSSTLVRHRSHVPRATRTPRHS